MCQFITNDAPKAVYRLQYGIHHKWNGLGRWNLIFLDSCVLALRRDNQKKKVDFLLIFVSIIFLCFFFFFLLEGSLSERWIISSWFSFVLSLWTGCSSRHFSEIFSSISKYYFQQTNCEESLAITPLHFLCFVRCFSTCFFHFLLCTH